jgi:hypothetical protein
MTTPFEHLSTEFWNFCEVYVGTKEIEAIAMTRGEYNSIRGWVMPTGENPNDGGYIVRYKDGYVSWSPEFTFDSAYTPVDHMNFGDALHFMKEGKQLARAGWNGKDMFVFLVQGSVFNVNRPPLLGIYEEGTEINYQSHVDMKTADGTIVPWLCNQSDMLANDWQVV